MKDFKETIDNLDKLNDIVNRDIQSIIAKGEIKPEQYDNLEKATSIMKNTQKAKQIMCELSEMDDENSFGYSMRRGRSATTGRHVSMGYPYEHHMENHSFARRNNYGMNRSMHSYKDRAIATLEAKIAEAPTEADRMFMEELLNFAEERM